MSHLGKRAWRDGMQTHQLYLVGNETHIDERLGNCWAAGRLREGDILLCDKLTGDCFYDYFLIDWTTYENRRTVEMNIVPYSIGAYALNAPMLKGLTPRDYHLLMAGETVRVRVKIPEWVLKLKRL